MATGTTRLAMAEDIEAFSHEAGHAIQHANAYAPLKARTAIVPVVNIGSKLGFGLLIVGILMSNMTVGWIGVALFATTTMFALVTLPVEFDASKRAKAATPQEDQRERATVLQL